MTQVPLAPPPPTGGPIDGWLYLLWRRFTQAGQILWSSLDFTGSNLTDIATRNHADLQNIDTATYTHLTATNATDLTDGGATTLHKHDHAAQDNLNSASYTHLTAANHTDLTDSGDSTLHYHASDRSLANTTGLGTGIGTALAIAVGSAGAPVLFDGAGGTPSSLTLTNATGLPAVGVTGTALVSAAIGTTVQAYDADLTTWAGITPGANVGTALAVAVGTDGAFVVKGGALGTPSSGTLTNCSFPTLNQNTTGYAGALKSATTTVSVSAATAPSSGQVLTATSDSLATWQTPAASGNSAYTYAFAAAHG